MNDRHHHHHRQPRSAGISQLVLPQYHKRLVIIIFAIILVYSISTFRQTNEFLVTIQSITTSQDEEIKHISSYSNNRDNPNDQSSTNDVNTHPTTGLHQDDDSKHTNKDNSSKDDDIFDNSSSNNYYNDDETIIIQNETINHSSKEKDQSKSSSNNDSHHETGNLLFNSINPHAESWCPYATCHNSPLCSPCQRRYLFIIASGRSGSTTLLKMMNYLPNVRLSGENYNELYVASRILTPTTTTMHLNDYNTTTSMMMNPENPTQQALACVMQQVVYTINPPPLSIQLQTSNSNIHPQSIEEYDQSTILGVKTIRFHKEWDVYNATQFLIQNFPCSKIIINIRSDIQHQIDSWEHTMAHKMKSKFQNDTQHFFDSINGWLVQLGDLLGKDRAKVIDMIDWTKDVEILNDVVKWLGFEGCRFESVLHENFDGFGHDHSAVNLGENCRYPYL